MNYSQLEIFLEDFKILSDEPEQEQIAFRFESLSAELADFVLEKNMLTPFVLGIDGEWGSGKTTLMKNIENKINEKIKDDEERDQTYHVIWFDAWKFEKFDPVLALYQHLLKVLGDQKGLKEKILRTGILVSDILSNKFLEISTKDIAKELNNIHGFYSDVIDDVGEQFSKTIQDSIGDDGRIIVFIDDLDRCENENILSIFANIKQILNVKNMVFILGIDMKKIERAWGIKHDPNSEITKEGREHVDKLFQLKIKLPLKHHPDFVSYAIKTCPSLPNIEAQFIGRSVRRNPRKLKHVLNLYYFALKSYKKKLDEYAKEFPEVLTDDILIDKLGAITFGVVLKSAHANLIDGVGGNYGAFFEAATLVKESGFNNVKPNVAILRNLQLGKEGTPNTLISPNMNIKYSRDKVNTSTVELLERIQDDWESYNLLDSLNYFIREGGFSTDKNKQHRLLGHAINSIPLVSFGVDRDKYE